MGTGALYVSRRHQEALEPMLTTNALEADRAYSRGPLARFRLASQSPGLMAGFTEAVRELRR